MQPLFFQNIHLAAQSTGKLWECLTARAGSLHPTQFQGESGDEGSPGFLVFPDVVSGGESTASAGSH